MILMTWGVKEYSHKNSQQGKTWPVFNWLYFHPQVGYVPRVNFSGHGIENCFIDEVSVPSDKNFLSRSDVHESLCVQEKRICSVSLGSVSQCRQCRKQLHVTKFQHPQMNTFCLAETFYEKCFSTLAEYTKHENILH